VLDVRFHRIRSDQLDALRAWMAELMRRQDEVRETFRNEGVRHEQAFLLQSVDGPVLIYAHEVDDPEAARRAYLASTLPVDLQHREVMRTALDGAAEAELLYEVRVDPSPSASSGSG
jgi:hypothetical protein